MTFVAAGIENILSQALEQLGYDWEYMVQQGHLTYVGIQYCLKFTPNPANGQSVDYIYGRSCVNRHEAKESALVRALHYIDTECGYTIQDVRYWQWRQIRVASGL